MRIALAVCFMAGVVALPASAQQNPYDKILGRVTPSFIDLKERTGQIDLAPDGKSVVFSAYGGPRIVSFPGGEPIRQFSENTIYPIAVAAFTPDGKRVVGAQPGLRTWEVATGKLLLSVNWDWLDRQRLPPDPPDPRWPLTPPVFSPDRGRVYVSAPGDVVTAWDTATGKEVARSARIGQRARSMSLSADGKYLGLGFPDGFRVWEAATFKEVFGKALPANGHNGKLDTYRVSFDPQGKKVFVMGASTSIMAGVGPGAATVWVDELQAWDLARKELLYRTQISPFDHFDCVLVLPGGRYGLVGNSHGSGGNVIELDTGRMLGSILIRGRCHPLVLTAGGKEFLAGTNSDSLSLIRVEDIMKLLPGNSR